VTSPHLVVFSIGPVQTFLISARRTRDLWCGSKLLSDMARAVAASLPVEWTRVVPDPGYQVDSAASLGNVVFAVAPDAQSIGSGVENARQGALAKFGEYATHAYKLGNGLINKTEWKRQIEHGNAIEFYAAWQAMVGDYPQVRAAVMRKLASVKALRAFTQESAAAQSSFKSSLDGVSESVLLVSGRGRADVLDNRATILADNPTLAFRLRLRRGEELDAISFIKRAALGETFPSVTRIAIDPWLRGFSGKPADVQKLKALNARMMALSCARDAADSLASGSGQHYQDANTAYASDGAIFLNGRLDSMIRDCRASGEGRLAAGLEEVKVDVEAITKDSGHPHPYYALLVADGDGIGKLFSACQSANAQGELSALLRGTAAEMRSVIEEHHGVVVFAAGEDLMAFLPLDGLPAAIVALQTAFATTLQKDSAVKATGAQPTLSVGVAIAHCLEAMEDVLGGARVAEQKAKQHRRVIINEEGYKGAVCMTWMPRNGAGFDLLGGVELCQRLGHWAQFAYEDVLADAFGYQLKQVQRRYGLWPNSDAHCVELRLQALGLELQRLLKRRKGNAQTSKQLADATDAVLAVHRDSPEAAITQLAHELILARRIAESMRDAKPTRPTEPSEVSGPDDPSRPCESTS